MRFANPGEDHRTMRRRMHAEFHEYRCRLIEEKRRHPGDDLTTLLVQAEIDGRALTDQQLHGQTIKAGEHVGIWYGAANRDPRVFDRPYEIDITRNPNEHLGVGHGQHFCLGSNLARWELRAAFRAVAGTELLERLEPAAEPQWLTDFHVGAYSQALVRYRH
ncbi:MAG: cytochrome P450 [Acidimicrobiia bacterium]|nr:cytochrome P450 [Acidimicrobiia bacterium]MDH4362904.1 cytochrome P450 [Acidimicrobiia bacterium]